jgi:hypothetical protein
VLCADETSTQRLNPFSVMGSIVNVAWGKDSKKRGRARNEKHVNCGIRFECPTRESIFPRFGVRSSAGNCVVATDATSQRKTTYLPIVTNRNRRDDRFQGCSKQLSPARSLAQPGMRCALP